MRDTRPTFLRWALVNALFLVALILAAVLYDGHLHSAAVVAVATVLAVYATTAAYCGWVAWRIDEAGRYGLRTTLSRKAEADPHIAFAISLCPRLALLGTVAGFLISFSGSTDGLQERALGASTGLAATFVGIACMIVLELQRHVLRAHA